ncbi:aldose 1-epimerase [Meiothermus sp.]|jgi:aldose 1-epimerase|uniref:aldose 1-epimerase n=1 Tax=Meiothermus sp. TaxID=1955249 RepID=UPI0021DEE86D|nr:aldose 1-epimerase [Meiothermus sp.]GIW24347.1 MAG: aldose 1-epimerase [Meiothermus sp.]
MNLQILQNQRLRLTVAPELGASVVGLELYRQGFWLPILRPTPPAALIQHCSPDTSSYLLAPYSNRIRDGRFSFAGKTHQLRPNWADGRQTIHGEVHGRAWALQRVEENALECHFDSRVVPDVNFPFPFAVAVQYRLLEDEVVIQTTLQNVGTEPMPAGLGHHPYFMRRLGLSDEALLSFRAERVYLTDASCLPTRPAEAIPPQFDFSQPRPLGGLSLDHVFAGWEGILRLDWPGSGWQLELRADPIFSHLVVFTAPDGSVALEPVTHATDGFNLMAQGWPDTGVQILPGGQQMKGQVRIRLLAQK